MPFPLEKASFTLWRSVLLLHMHYLHRTDSDKAFHVVTVRLLIEYLSLDLVPFNEILCCFVNAEFLKANVLLF